MIFRHQQLVVVLLSMNINQERGNFPQNLHRCRASIDLADISSTQLSGNQKGVIGGFKPHLFYCLPNMPGQLGEKGRKVSALFPATDDILAQSGAQNPIDCRDQNGFSGSGFSGKDIELRPEIDDRFGDNGNIFNVQL